MDDGIVIGASLVSQATATEVRAAGVNRQPWANAPFIPGPLADYMDAQFVFFNSKKISEEGRPIIAGLNCFLTHENRGGPGSGLLGEKRDVKVWMGWLELYAHGDVEAIETPVGMLPKYEDLKKLFDGSGFSLSTGRRRRCLKPSRRNTVLWFRSINWRERIGFILDSSGSCYLPFRI